MKRGREVVFPLLSTDHGATLDRLALRLGVMPGFCNICGRLTVFRFHHPNFREDCICLRCGASNRQRQLAYVICHPSRIRRLVQFARQTPLAIYNTEGSKAIHGTLRGPC